MRNRCTGYSERMVLPRVFALRSKPDERLRPARGVRATRCLLAGIVLAMAAAVVPLSAQSLTITTSSLPNANVGVPYSQQITAAGGVTPYKWALPSLLPVIDGLSINQTTGVLSGTPIVPQTLNLEIQVGDSSSPPVFVIKTIRLVVGGAPVSLTTTSLLSAFNGVSYFQQLTAEGGQAPFKWSVSAGTLPPGLTLDPNAGTISGKPTVVGNSNFTIQVADSSSPPTTSTKALSISVATLTPLLLSSQALPGGTVGTPYSQIVQASGGATPYVWTVPAGALPAGLLLSASGTLSGVPTAAGAYAFTAQLTDGAGATARAAVTVTLASASLQITATTLPSGMVGVPYPVQIFAATGGAPPYTFSVAAAGLPAGLRFSAGQLNGTPTAGGTSSLNVTVTDSAQPAATSSATLPLLVRPSGPADLLLSTGTVSFAITTDTSAVPAPANITVASSDAATALNYQVSVNPSVSWLTVSGGLARTTSTPGSIGIALNSQALTLTPQAAAYQTSIVVACVSPSPCAGSSYRANVALTISSPPPQLVLTDSLVSLSANGTQTQATGIFGVRNAGAGTITVNSVSAADSWLTVSGVPGSIPAGPAIYATVTANASGFKPGLYRSSITVSTSAGAANLPVTLLFSNGKVMTLNPAGQQFQMTTGETTGNPNGSFQVLVDATSAVSWTAAVVPGSRWLALKTASGSSTAASPAAVNFSIDPSSAALSAGTYYGTIRVTSNQVSNTPQDFLVVLNISPTGATVDPDLQPGGLLFISDTTAALPPQNLTLYAGSTRPVTYQAAALTESGQQWLSVSPTSGTASSTAPAKPTVSVNTAGLSAGTYRGRVTYAFSAASVRSVSVTLIVPGATGGVLPFGRIRPAAANCTASSLVLNPSGPAGNFSTPASWPATLVVTLADNCGNLVGNGNVTVNFNNNDAPIALIPDPTQPGNYRGTWTPRGASSQLTITANAKAPGLTGASVTIPGQVVLNPAAAPALTPGGTLNVFNPALGGGIAPGTAVEIFGTNFAAPGTIFTPASLPFPTEYKGTSVLIGGVPAPLYFVSPGQINAQAPYGLVPGTPYQVIVSAAGALTMGDRVQVTPAAPGIAAFQSGGLIAQHLDNSLVTDTAPAKPGEILIIYLTGMGNTANDPADGSGAAAPPTSTLPQTTATVALDGAPVSTIFVGLTPGSVGLYQIALTVPAGATDGLHQLTVLQGGVSSNVTILPVKK